STAVAAAPGPGGAGAGVCAAAAPAAAPAGRTTRITIAHQLKSSVVPPVAVCAQMRRILRPRGRAVKRLPFAARGVKPDNLIRRLNAGEVLPAPVKPIPAGPLSEATLADAVQPPPRPRWLASLLAKFTWLPRATLILALVVLLIALLAAFLAAPVTLW